MEEIGENSIRDLMEPRAKCLKSNFKMHFGENVSNLNNESKESAESWS